MDAWILDESPGTYRWGMIDDPVPGPGEVRVRVVASALNHLDLWVMRGQPKPPLPHVPGCDVAGVVDAVGDDVEGIDVGQEVVINPGVSPVADIVALGNASPRGATAPPAGAGRGGGAPPPPPPPPLEMSSLGRRRGVGKSAPPTRSPT